MARAAVVDTGRNKIHHPTAIDCLLLSAYRPLICMFRSCYHGLFPRVLRSSFDVNFALLPILSYFFHSRFHCRSSSPAHDALLPYIFSSLYSFLYHDREAVFLLTSHVGLLWLLLLVITAICSVASCSSRCMLAILRYSAWLFCHFIKLCGSLYA
jgi:hypothetical protein